MIELSQTEKEQAEGAIEEWMDVQDRIAQVKLEGSSIEENIATLVRLKKADVKSYLTDLKNRKEGTSVTKVDVIQEMRETFE